MEIILGIILSLVFAHFIGKIGERRWIGYGMSFFISFIFSPLIGLIITLLSTKNSPSQNVNTNNSSNMLERGHTEDNDFTRLTSLKEKGVLSNQDYLNTCQRIYDIDFESEFTQSNAFTELKISNKNNILTDLEFNTKLAELKNEQKLKSTNDILKHLQEKYLTSYNYIASETIPVDISNEQQEWISNDNVCPACGYKGIEQKQKCPDCGISLW